MARKLAHGWARVLHMGHETHGTSPFKSLADAMIWIRSKARARRLQAGNPLATKVDAIEVGEAREGCNVEACYPRPLEQNQPLLPQAPERSVDVRHAQPERVGNQLLGKGEAIGTLVSQSGDLQAEQELQQQARHALIGRLAAHSDQVLGKKRRLVSRHPE